MKPPRALANRILNGLGVGTRATDIGRVPPPGDLIDLDVIEKSNRRAIDQRATQFGPVFKGLARGDQWVCIVGLKRGRRFLQDHGTDLEVCSWDITMLFGKGDMRRMTDDDHRDYRKALVHAIRSPDADAGVAELNEIVARSLRAYHADSAEHGNGSEAFAAMTRAIATELLVRVFFGAVYGSRAAALFVAGYAEMGPYGLVWNPQQRQIDAYGQIRDHLRAELADLARGHGDITSTCIAATLDAAGKLDDAMLGNLITMVEMGRSDVQVLLRWLTRYSAQNPEILDDIAREQNSPPAQGWSLAEAFVREVLRTDQSERLERKALRDIRFEGHFIAAGTFIRVCLWESHHDDGSFSDPFRFDPLRFVRSSPAPDVFAPFGLDHHKCPFADLTIRIGTQFLYALARDYRVELRSDGEPYRGAYHWEPPRRLAVELISR